MSSTPGKDDKEDDEVDDQNKIDNALAEYAEQQVEVRDKEQAPIKVEESMPVEDHREETTPIIKEEVQIVSLTAPEQQPLAFIKTR